MPLVLANRIQETTTTTGTGTITLAGAVSGFQSFAVIGNTNTTYYTITSGTAWEVGIGTYSTTGPTLARTTILASSNAGAAITLSGTSTVFATYPAERSVSTDNTATLTNKTLSLEAYSTAATVTAGTNAQGQGALTNDVNIVTTTSSNPSGVTLPTAFAGAKIVVVNRGTNPINIYPATGGNINGGTTNAAVSLQVSAALEFVAISTTTWYTVSAFNTASGTTPLLATSQGGTGLSGSAPFTANRALYATSTTALTTGILPIAAGGTAVGSTPANGQLLIGNGSGYTLANLSAGSNISISNSSGAITISSTAASSPVTYLGSTSIFTSPTTINLAAPFTTRLLLIFEDVAFTGSLQLQFVNSGSTLSSGYAYANSVLSGSSPFATVLNGTSASNIVIHPGSSFPGGSVTVSGYLWVNGPWPFSAFSDYASVVGSLSSNGLDSITSQFGGTNSNLLSPNAGVVLSASTSLSGGTVYAYSYQ